MPTISAVIFDLDDTLFDHRGAADIAVLEWLRALEAATSDELVALWVDAENRHVAAWNRGEVAFDEQRRRRVREMLDHVGLPDREDALVDALYANYLSHYERNWRSFDDAETGLAAVADAGLPFAVLTNGADHQQRQKLTATGLDRLIPRMHCCDLVGFAKPDPRSYRAVCDWLGLSYGEVLHIGDRHDLDVAGAREAGLQALHLDRYGTGPADETQRIGSLHELQALLPTSPTR
jgi:putative hydrolase of the HAD superfamily